MFELCCKDTPRNPSADGNVAQPEVSPMNIPGLVPNKWSEYELLDSGEGRRLERFGQYTADRPDPSVIWPKGDGKLWDSADAYYNEETKSWEFRRQIPESWKLAYQDLVIKVRPTPFKHLGVFPEQGVNWSYISDKVKSAGHEVKVLNLFGYTGLSSLVAAKAGATVTHVDASKPALTWAHENADLSRIPEGRMRYILDDAREFVWRELRRNNHYDGILMDPPVFGHGPAGKAWDFGRDFPELLADCIKLLTPEPLFVVINAYAVSMSALSLGNALMSATEKLGGQVEIGELALSESSGGRLLSTGILARWSRS